MTLENALPAGALRRGCDPDRFDFETTRDLDVDDEVLGQPRATAAVRFGTRIDREGYNIFALGKPGTGRRVVVGQFLGRRAAERPVPSDWCYVQNFDESRSPRALRLPAGKGTRFRRDMEHFVEELRSALSAALESEDYQSRRQAIDEEVGAEQSRALSELERKAEQRGLRAVRSPAGIGFVPVRDGHPVPPEEIQRLSGEEKKQLEKEAEELQRELQKALRQQPRWQRERREKLRELNRRVTEFAAGPLLEELRSEYGDSPDVAAYLEAVERDIVENARSFVAGQDELQPGQQMLAALTGHAPQQAAAERDRSMRRYRVNVVVDNSRIEGAPVVHEDHPTYANLVGRVEHVSQLGALTTDFNMIRGGALHRANGGYLVVDALKLLREPYAWEGLKRALRARRLRIESLGEALSLVQTVSLEPQPVPLDVKVVLIGEPWIYYLLCQRDPEFPELFKVAADFDDRLERSDESQARYARLIARLVDDEGLRPFDRGAVARTIEWASRIAGDSERLSLEVRRTFDLLREADYFATEAGRDVVGTGDVDRAVDEQVYRAGRIRDRLREETLRDVLRVETDGSAVGQVNALAVVDAGTFSFGRVNRITAQARLGSGEVVDIEREAKLSGPVHSKGVLILSGFLGARYSADAPLSLAASLVFEQSYTGVEGDSASAAELYALLSAIGGMPVRQSLAVTGSVDQHGRLQAVGGLNEKIEAFFDLCRERGLTGEQGVLIPASNRPHLMLRQDLVDAVEDRRFNVYAVGDVDAGLEILTGLAAGRLDESGRYPEGSANGRVQARLAELAQRRRAFAREAAEGAAS